MKHKRSSSEPRVSEQSKNVAGNLEFIARRGKQLLTHSQAYRYLTQDLMLKENTVSKMKLGLSERYSPKGQAPRANALIAPVVNENGVFTKKNIYLNIPGITENPLAVDYWTKGEPESYFSAHSSGSKELVSSSILICESPVDVWLLRQNLQSKKEIRNITLICSTHSSEFPEEWSHSAFWGKYKNIYIGFGSGTDNEQLASRLLRTISKECFRVAPPESKALSWKEFFTNGGSVDEFCRQLENTKLFGAKVQSGTEDNSAIGRFAYKPINISTAFHDGLLYYCLRTLTNEDENVRGSNGEMVKRKTSRKEAVVVCSNRTTLTAHQIPAPPGTLPEDRVWRLSNGILIDGPLKAPEKTTWRWESVLRYLGGETCTRPLIEILNNIKSFLKSAVWLPSDHDYDLLALLVPVTFAQAIFDAVPIVLVNGPPASGKSELGNSLQKICCNPQIIGQGTKAGMTRLADESNGLLIFDDLETIGTSKGRSKDDQLFVTGYKKSTAHRILSNAKRGFSAESLNFYGVKVITNTTGADSILRTRMIVIKTKKLTKDIALDFQGSEIWTAAELNNLRDELHCWTFENDELINRVYRKIIAVVSTRNDEIAAPLRVFAEIAGSSQIAEGLESALASQATAPGKPMHPLTVLEEAAKNLVREGYSAFSPTHLSLEMQSLYREKYNAPDIDEKETWNSANWIGKALRQMEIVDRNAMPARLYVWGRSLRIYPVREQFLNKSRTDVSNIQDCKPMDFCKSCLDCRYGKVKCPIRETRV